MPAIRLLLLSFAVLGVIVRPRAIPHWVAPVVGLVAGIGVGAIQLGDIDDAARPLVEPLAFLLFAVPMALLLDRLGFFEAIAAHIDESRHLHLWAWAFAAAVTTVFNLDSSVVLLTPLYVRIARRHGIDPLAGAFVPVLLASLASSALPVSNLTNLLAADRFDVGVRDFATRLGPASLAATAVGYIAYRRAFDLRAVREPVHLPIDDRAIVRGAPVVLCVLLGFTIGDVVGIAPWVVAAVADVVLIGMTRWIPWRVVPVGAIALASALGVLAAAAAPHLDLDHALGAGGGADTLRVTGIGIVGANAINNLPAALIGLPALGADPGDRLWAFLLGVNMGPALVVSGSIAGLLWLDTTRRLGVPVDARTYFRVGARVGGPAIIAATVALLLTDVLAS